MQGLSRSPNGGSQCAVCAAHSGLAGKLAEQSDKLQFAELAQRFTKPHFIEHIQCRRYRMAKKTFLQLESHQRSLAESMYLICLIAGCFPFESGCKQTNCQDDQ